MTTQSAPPTRGVDFSIAARVPYVSGCRRRVTIPSVDFDAEGARLLRRQFEKSSPEYAAAVGFVKLQRTPPWTSGKAVPPQLARDVAAHFGARYLRVEFAACGGEGLVLWGVLPEGRGREAIKAQVVWDERGLMRVRREASALAECARAFRGAPEGGEGAASAVVPATFAGRQALIEFAGRVASDDAWEPCVDLVRRDGRDGEALTGVAPLSETCVALGLPATVRATLFVVRAASGVNAQDVIDKVYEVLRSRPDDLAVAREAAHLLARVAALVEKSVVGVALAGLSHNDVKLDNLFVHFVPGDGRPVDATAIDTGKATCLRPQLARAALLGWAVEDGVPAALALAVEVAETGTFVEKQGYPFFQSSRALVAHLLRQAAAQASRGGLASRDVEVAARRAVWTPHARIVEP